MVFGGIITGIGVSFLACGIYHLCCLSIRSFPQNWCRNLLDCLCCIENDWILDCWDRSKLGCIYYFTISLTFFIFFLREATQTKSDGSILGCLMYFFTGCYMLTYGRIRDTTRRRHPPAVIPFTVNIVEVYVERSEVITVKDGIVYTYLCEWCNEETSQECQKCVCAICLQSMHEKNVIQFRRCVHAFHDTCWKQMQKSNCPVCRQL